MNFDHRNAKSFSNRQQKKSKKKYSQIVRVVAALLNNFFLKMKCTHIVHGNYLTFHINFLLTFSLSCFNVELVLFKKLKRNNNISHRDSTLWDQIVFKLIQLGDNKKSLIFVTKC